jgi:hypothetical protein
LTRQRDKRLSGNRQGHVLRVVADRSLFGGGAASAAPLLAPRLSPAPWMGPQWRGPSGAAVVPVVVLATLYSRLRHACSVVAGDAIGQA